jgi:tetratricopeptide (TPR) repeat protein
LRRIRQVYPSDFWANHDLANILQVHHFQFEEAIRYYTAALALRPHNPVACVNLGTALHVIGDLDGAIAALREAIDGQPDYVIAYVTLGRLLEAKGDADGAIAALRTANRFTNTAYAHLHLGNMLFRSGRRGEAIESYKKAVALDPKLGMAHYNLGIALLEKKECLDEAIASFQSAIACGRRAIEGNPRDAGVYNGLAWVLATCPRVPLRDPVEAVKQAQKAVELSPNWANGWNTLGVGHYRAGNWKEAIAVLEKSMQLHGGSGSYDWFFLAMAYWRLGEKEKARDCFDKAVQWMDKHMPKGKELGRFRAEAAELLKIEAEKK